MLGFHLHSGDRCLYSSYGVNRDRLCGTNALLSVAFTRLAAMKPLEEVQTQSSFVCLLDSKMVWQCQNGEGEETGAVIVS